LPRAQSPVVDLRRRLRACEERAAKYQMEGLPIPTAELADEFDKAVRDGRLEDARAAVQRAEMFLARADQDWGWLRELLQRVDDLRAIAEAVGLDLVRIDARVGNPRATLSEEALTTASLEKAAASASFALAVLNDAIPKYIVQEAKSLGGSIRRARDRGEDVRQAVGAFSALLAAVQEPALGATVDRLGEARKSVARIPRAPPVAAVSDEEEEEILTEARNLARRLHRIKTRAHVATDAVRLISQVRQALSEDRRYVSPEEEVEALWAEVDRLTREKRLAAAGPPLAPGEEAGGGLTPHEEPAFGVPEGAPGSPEAAALPALTEDSGSSPSVDEPARTARLPVARTTAPPPAVPAPSSASPQPGATPRGLMPIVPPMVPLPDEEAGAPAPQSPDTLADGAGPRAPRPTRIAIAAAYVPPDLADAASGAAASPTAESYRRSRSRHRE
jgi:hypothetical protein